MKKRYNTIVWLCLLLAAGCAEDKGNYTYKELNDVFIDIINENRTITRSPQEVLKLEGKFSRRLDSSTEGLNYAWIIGSDTVATTRDLDYVIPDGITYGDKRSKFEVTDTKTGMVYYRTFNVSIVNPFSFGYYILCKNPDNSSIIAYLSSTAEEPVFMHTNRIGDYELGKHPTQIEGYFGNISELNGYYWTMYFCSKEGEYPVIVSNCATLLPTLLLNNQSFADHQERTFSPTNLEKPVYNSDPWFLSDGQLIGQVSQYLYRPAKHKDNYYWSRLRIGMMYICLFDRLSGKFFIASPDQTDLEAGTVYDKYAYDRVTEVADCKVFQENKILQMTLKDYSYFLITSATEKGIAIDSVFFDDTKYTARFSEGITIPYVNTSDRIKGLAVGSSNIDWYFAIGNEIYSSPDILHKLTKFVDIPAELGEIREMKASAKNDQIVLTCYNESTGKGSFVRIWIQNKKIDIFKDVLSEPVSLFCADANPWW